MVWFFIYLRLLNISLYAKPQTTELFDLFVFAEANLSGKSDYLSTDDTCIKFDFFAFGSEFGQLSYDDIVQSNHNTTDILVVDSGTPRVIGSSAHTSAVNLSSELCKNVPIPEIANTKISDIASKSKSDESIVEKSIFKTFRIPKLNSNNQTAVMNSAVMNSAVKKSNFGCLTMEKLEEFDIPENIINIEFKNDDASKIAFKELIQLRDKLNTAEEYHSLSSAMVFFEEAASVERRDYDLKAVQIILRSRIDKTISIKIAVI